MRAISFSRLNISIPFGKQHTAADDVPLICYAIDIMYLTESKIL